MGGGWAALDRPPPTAALDIGSPPTLSPPPSHLGGDAGGLADQAQQDLLGAHKVMAQAAGLCAGWVGQGRALAPVSIVDIQTRGGQRQQPRHTARCRECRCPGTAKGASGGRRAAGGQGPRLASRRGRRPAPGRRHLAQPRHPGVVENKERVWGMECRTGNPDHGPKGLAETRGRLAPAPAPRRRWRLRESGADRHLPPDSQL